jgi:3-dehydro-L-gulonate 2-dehydrogenase
MTDNAFIRVNADEMQQLFYNILLNLGFDNEKALQCSQVFTANSIDGVYTHGVNRFSIFVKYIKDGLIVKDAKPALQSAFGGIEQWNGNLGAGPLNAIHATERAIKLSEIYGISCITMCNTNHWMRGGYYGWLAAKRGCVFMGWSNTIANMPAWNAVESKLGNNPFVMAVPYNNEAIVLDMAMSQFSFGAMELAAMKNEKLPVQGGYDSNGNLTDDPGAIIKAKRPLPIGYWKGAGLSLLLDILASLLSGGLATNQITKQGTEHNLSQVFICINLHKLSNTSLIATIVNEIIEDYHRSDTGLSTNKVRFPGERVLQTREKNLAEGIPVLKKVWEEILSLENVFRKT